MASETDICNLALLRIGQGSRIASLDEESEPADLCELLLPLARDDTLRAWSWPFASRRQDLALVEEEPSTDWAYSYRVPSDYLVAIRIIPTDGRNGRARIPFEVEGDNTGGLLFTDQTDAVLHYIARVENAGLFPPDFVDALAWRLAMDLAEPLARDQGRAEKAERNWKRALERAQANAANEVLNRPEPDSGLEDART